MNSLLFILKVSTHTHTSTFVRIFSQIGTTGICRVILEIYILLLFCSFFRYIRITKVKHRNYRLKKRRWKKWKNHLSENGLFLTDGTFKEESKISDDRTECTLEENENRYTYPCSFASSVAGTDRTLKGKLIKLQRHFNFNRENKRTLGA